MKRESLNYLVLFLSTSAVLALFAWDRVLGPSPHFHFLDLANSFLEGRLDTETPRRYRGQAPRPDDARGRQEAVDRHLTGGDGKGIGWNDWASVRTIRLTDGTEVRGVFPWSDQQGDARKKFRTLDGTEMVIDDVDIARDCGDGGARCDETTYFVSFPPFPAIAMMPLFLIFGYDTNDVLFTVLDGGLNAVILFALLQFLSRRKLSGRTTAENVLITVLFTFGSVNFFSAIRGEVWFSALILGLTLHLAYIFFAVEARRPFLAGLMLALGMATRTPIAFAFPFFALEMFRDGERFRWPGMAVVLKKGALFAAPIIAVGLALAWYNMARFDSPGEFGHTFLAGGTRASIRDHGLFSFWFLKNNLAAALTNPPVFDSFPPFIHITRHGISVFFVTPALLWAFWPRARTSIYRNLAITAAIVAIPGFLYQNTGWAQYGYRFALDFMPYLLAMLAVSARGFDRPFWVAFGLSILMGTLGAVTFDRMASFYYD